MRSGLDPEVLEVDEDLLFAFKVDVGWLLVCETSVRLIEERREIARVEFGDVIEHAQWEQSELEVRDARGLQTHIGVERNRLVH